ncbi:MAG: leucine-rich repeat protein, partial [Deltaproteobacteria bacterium]|nr:leucine-rich repeat protein [Deltaproteobacteria bacterium]
MRRGKLAVMLYACIFLFLALPALALESDNFTCTVSGVDTLTITGYTGPGGAVIIPSMLAGRPVVGIGAGAFLNRSRLTSVTIPAGVTIIGPLAFSGCSGLRHVFFHGHAPVMGASVFAGCASDFTVYADSGKAGFTYPKWDGYRAAPCTDADHDGYYMQGGACGPVDCNDNTSAAKPGAAEACNGIDDDCDGTPDNGLPFSYFFRDADADGYGDPDSAGRVLACEQPEGYADNRTGLDCDDNDTAVHPGAPDENCNGVDEDCDNETDEGYQGVATRCGIGACARSGSTSCPAGAEAPVDSCAAGAPAAADATCDSIDDDCDGAADEDYVAIPTSCGAGACMSEGVLACVNGAVQDTCAAGRPSRDA